MGIILKDKTSIIIDNKVIDAVRATGCSVNAVLEEMYSEELATARQNAIFQDKSATKLALLDNDIRGNHKVQNLFTTNDNEFLFPVYMADLVETTIATDDYMSYLVSGEMTIDQTIIEAPTLDLMSDENKKQLKKSRVAEGAEFPERTIKIGSTSAKLYKKGVRLGQTYEASRRMNIDLMSKALNAISGDIVGQNIEDAKSVLEKAKNMFSLGSTTTANTVTNKELLGFIFDYVDRFGYAPTTILAPKEIYRNMYDMVYNSNELAGLSQQLKLNFPKVKLENIDIIPADVSQKGGKNRALMYNKDYTLTRYVENGSSLTEYAQNILNQKNEVVMSEVSGYGLFVESVSEFVSA